MKRIILFRFHKNPIACENRLKLLKKLNPSIKIFGYFEEEKKYKKFKQRLNPYLEDVFFINGKSSNWFWKNSDIAVRMWYKYFGRKLNFDMLHLVEWDLLFLDSLENLYKRIPKNGIGLTALILLSKVEKRWSWTAEEPHKTEWEKLLALVKKEFNYTEVNYASLGPGVCLPKKFLEKFINIKVPELSNDELRLPLFGRILGFELYDTGFYRRWFDKKEKQFFHCGSSQEIYLSTIKKELAKPSGRRAFHPFRKVFNLKLLD